MEEDVYIGIGSNLGDRERNCNLAIQAIKEKGINVIKISPVYETEPWGVKEQPPFLNLVLWCRTVLEPAELLGCLKDIEKTVGRKKTFRWGPRIVDLDILFYGERVINEAQLIVPHPHLRERAFVLKPLSDIAPDFKDPVTGMTIRELLNGVQQSEIIKRQEGL